jgi:hypothetical protein
LKKNEKKKDPQRLYETLLKKYYFKPHIDLISETTFIWLDSYILNGTPDHIPKPDEVFLVVYWFFEAEGSFNGSMENKGFKLNFRKILL